MGVVVERSAQGIAYIVAEGCDTRHLADVGFYAQLFRRQGALTGAPAFAVDEDTWIYLVHGLTDVVHRLDVVNAHEVEAEAVDMVLANPIEHALRHKASHHRTLRSCFVTTAGTIAIYLAPILLLLVPIIIILKCPLEVAMLYVIGVVIDDVEDDGDASLVQRLNHLLELADAT